MFEKIPGFSKYVISRNGEIRCIVGNKTVPTHRSNGYVFTHIVNDEGQRLSVGLHRCLALAYIECPGDPNRLIVNHIDNDRGNNVLTNLEWATRSRNQAHAIEAGTGFAYPTKVVNIKTGEERTFVSKREALIHHGMRPFEWTKTTNFTYGDHKFIVETTDVGFDQFAKTLNGLMIRNIYTGLVTIVDSLHRASVFMNIEAKVLKRILRGSRFTYPINGFDIRSMSKDVKWPEYTPEELTAFKGLCFIHNPVWVKGLDGKETLYGSVLRASAFTTTYERTIRECAKNGKPCARGFRYRKHNRKTIHNV